MVMVAFVLIVSLSH